VDITPQAAVVAHTEVVVEGIPAAEDMGANN
jgi:hypothetical protein